MKNLTSEVDSYTARIRSKGVDAFSPSYTWQRGLFRGHNSFSFDVDGGQGYEEAVKEIVCL